MQIAPELVEACRRGDAGAFERFVRQTNRSIYTVVLRIVGNPDDAADVTQDVYIRIWRSIRGFRGDANIATWVHRIATNAALTHLKKRGRLAAPMEEEQMAERLATVDDEDQRLSAAEVERAVERLPDAYRPLIVLKDMYGMTCEEIAEQMGMTEGAVKVRLFRARRKLAEDLTQGGVVVPMRKKKVQP
ncbi:MAG: RNA polymerase sigma factor [Actinomycetota bacterium]